MDTKKLNELNELAKKATPGPWFSIWVGDNMCSVSTDAQDDNKSIAIEPIAENDAAYIAAANPQTILMLIEEIERLKKLDELWRYDYENMVAHADELDKEADWLAKMQQYDVLDDEPTRCPPNHVITKDCADSCEECWRKAARKAISRG